jgi:hypothetical protein
MELAGAGSDDQIKTAPNVRSADSDEALQQQVRPLHGINSSSARPSRSCAAALPYCLPPVSAKQTCWHQLSSRPPRGPRLWTLHVAVMMTVL